MRIFLIVGFLGSIGLSWGMQEPAYDTFPVPCRSDVKSFVDHTKKCINEDPSQKEQLVLLGNLVSLQNGDQDRADIKIRFSERIEQALEKAFGCRNIPEGSRDVGWSPLIPLYNSIKNNSCWQFLFFITRDATDKDTAHFESIKNLAYKTLLPAALKYIEESYKNLLLAQAKETDRKLDFCLKLAQKKELSTYWVEGVEPHLKECGAWEKMLHQPDLFAILEFEKKREYYEKMYQALYPSLRAGYDSYALFGQNQRRAALFTGILVDIAFVIIVYNAYNMFHLLQTYFNHDGDNTPDHVLKSQTVTASLSLPMNANSSQTRSFFTLPNLAVLGTIMGRQPESVKAFRNLSLWIPIIYRSRSEKDFDENVSRLALVSTFKVIQKEKEERTTYSESDRRKISAKVISIANMNAAHSFNAGTFAEALFRLWQWKNWTASGIVSSYAMNPSQLLLDESLIKKTFGGAFVSGLWDQSPANQKHSEEINISVL